MGGDSLRKIKTFFLVTAIPFGLVAGLSFRSYLKYDWLLIVVCTLLLGLAYGLIMTVAVFLFTRFKFSGCVGIILVGLVSMTGLVSGGILGIGSGAWIGKRLPTGDWKEIGHLPERPLEILEAHDNTVYVRTEQDSIYLCYDYLCKEDIEERFATVRRIAGVDLIDPLVPPVPGDVVLSYEYEFTAETVIQYNYVILEDGSLWRWRGGGWYWGDSDPPNFLAGSGLLIGLTLSLMVVRKSKVSAPPTTAPGEL